MAMTLGARHKELPDRTFEAFELRRLDWDTTHFGQRMGQLSFTPAHDDLRPAELTADLSRALSEAADDGYAHVILRVPAEELRLAGAAEQSGLRLVDVALDLATSLVGRQVLGVSPGIRPATADDLDVLRSIAESAFEFSRFAADPFFSSQQVAGFYRQWISNLCGGLAKIVLVAEASDEIVGFTSCALQPEGTGRIPLIATSDEHRRQGVGRALVDASLRWFSAAGTRNVRVKTQAANYPALAMYHRAGFTVAAAELTFSAILQGPGQIAR
jgi:TDP-D-fucosamine acetyltransferase